MAKVLPEVEGRFRILTGGCKPMMDMAEDQF
jgi:hypothetical protein